MKSFPIWPLVFCFSLFQTGCMVGPKYHSPEVALPSEFIEGEKRPVEFVSNSQLVSWWEQLNDPLLNQLIQEASSSNFDLRIAMERVLQARAEFRVDSAKLYPEFTLDAAAVRTRQSLNVFDSPASSDQVEERSPIYNLFQLGFDAIWELDFFGRLRHAKKAALFTWEAIQEQAREIQITVLSEIARTYVTVCAYQQLVGLSEESLFISQERLHLAEELFSAGLKSETQVQMERSTLDSDRATLEKLRSILRQTIYRLAVLMGKQPEETVALFQQQHPIPIASGKVPAGLPSDLLRRRPDIRGAERQIAAATEQIGIAVADLFPRVYLTANNLFSANPSGSNYGYASTQLSTLFRLSSQTWSIGPGFTLPLIDFGRRRAAVKAQTAIQKQSLLNYEKTVLTALEEVESSLVAYFREEERMLSFKDQTEATQRSYTLAESRYAAGLNDYEEYLSAKQTWIFSAKSLAESQQLLTQNLIAVYKAIGGDWECSLLP